MVAAHTDRNVKQAGPEHGQIRGKIASAHSNKDLGDQVD